MVEADCDIIVCIVGWAVGNGSVEDKAGLKSRGKQCRGTAVKNWSQNREWTGWAWRLAEQHSFILPIWEKDGQTHCMTELLYTVKQGEFTPVLLNITHLLLLNWLIERVGARPLALLSLENWGRREKKTINKKASQSNNELTCPRERKSVNKVQWRLLTEGPIFFRP